MLRSKRTAQRHCAEARDRCCPAPRGLQYGAVAHISLERRGTETTRRAPAAGSKTSGPGAAGECTPPMDVVETVGRHRARARPAGRPGVVADDRLLRRAPCSSPAGNPRRLRARQAAFHLAERQLRPVRARVRLTGAFDAGTATATLPTASCASCCRASRNGAAATSGFDSHRSLMNILFIGDIFGKPGREIVAARAARADRTARSIDFVIANGENSAAGFGITGDIADALFGYGIDVMTSGNHVWDKKEVLDYIPRQPKLLRPANFPAGVPGRGAYLGRTRTGEPVGVVNVMGRVFMTPLDDPFAVVLRGNRGAARQDAGDHRRLPRRGDVGEGRDGLAPRRPRHGGPRHAHARADRGRAHPAQGHGLHHRRRHDRPARLDHRRHRRSRARPLPQRACPRGSKRPAALAGSMPW